MKKLLVLLSILTLTGCSTKTITEIKYVDREVPTIQYVDREVIKEVEVETPVYIEKPGSPIYIEKEIIKEVEIPVETIIEKEVIKEVIKEVEVETIVEKEIIKEVEKEVVINSGTMNITFYDNFEINFDNNYEYLAVYNTLDWVNGHFVNITSLSTSLGIDSNTSNMYSDNFEGQITIGPAYMSGGTRYYAINRKNFENNKNYYLNNYGTICDSELNRNGFIILTNVQLIKNINDQFLLIYDEDYLVGVDILIDKNGYRQVHDNVDNGDLKFNKEDFYIGQKIKGVFEFYLYETRIGSDTYNVGLDTYNNNFRNKFNFIGDKNTVNLIRNKTNKLFRASNISFGDARHIYGTIEIISISTRDNGSDMLDITYKLCDDIELCYRFGSCTTSFMQVEYNESGYYIWNPNDVKYITFN